VPLRKRERFLAEKSVGNNQPTAVLQELIRFAKEDRFAIGYSDKE